MKNLQEATERICDLKGSLVALDALVTALLQELPAPLRANLLRSFEDNAEVARTVMLHTSISEHTITAFERDVNRMSHLIGAGPMHAPAQMPTPSPAPSPAPSSAPAPDGSL